MNMRNKCNLALKILSGRTYSIPLVPGHRGDGSEHNSGDKLPVSRRSLCLFHQPESCLFYPPQSWDTACFAWQKHLILVHLNTYTRFMSTFIHGILPDQLVQIGDMTVSFAHLEFQMQTIFG